MLKGKRKKHALTAFKFRTTWMCVRFAKLYTFLAQNLQVVLDLVRVRLRNGSKVPANLMVLLERRLDNTIYRAGFARTRAQARQFIVHGHIAIGGRKVNIPSYQIREGEDIEIRGESKKLMAVRDAIVASQAGQGLACLDCVLPLTVEDVGIDIRSLSRDGSLDIRRQSVQIEITTRAQRRRLIGQEGTCFLRVDLPLESRRIQGMDGQ